MAEKSSKQYNVPSAVTKEVRRREREKREREDAERSTDSDVSAADKKALKDLADFESNPITGLDEDEARFPPAERNARAQKQLNFFRDKAVEARRAKSQARGSDFARKDDIARTATEQENSARDYAERMAEQTGLPNAERVFGVPSGRTGNPSGRTPDPFSDTTAEEMGTAASPRSFKKGGLVRGSVRGGGVALRGLGKGKVY
jgi:hypothetical protein